MDMPFTVEQFFGVFRKYNESIFPMQIVLYVLGIVAVGSLFIKRSYSGRVISGVLGFFWLWMGVVYHIMSFSRINKAAYVFGALFVLEGFTLIYYGFGKGTLTFGL